MNDHGPIRIRVSGADAALLAWATAAVTNTIIIIRSFDLPPLIETRVLHHAFDCGHFLTLGLVSAAFAGAWARYGKARPRASAAALVALCLATGALLLPSDLTHATERHATGHPDWVQPALLAIYITVLSLAIPLALGVGRLAARPYVRWIPIFLGASALSWIPYFLAGDYPGTRFFLATASVSLLAAALAGATTPARFDRVLRPLARLAPLAKRLRTPLLAASALGAAASLVVTPRPTVALALLSSGGSLLPPLLGALRNEPPTGDAAIDPASAEWFADRKDAPPIPPSSPRILPENPAIILLSVDSLRADVVTSGKNDQKLPTIAALRRHGVFFRNARAPGAQTVYSLTTVFAGTYFSQQYWTQSTGDIRGLWPTQDDTVRFPELIRRRGAATITFASAPWLINQYGVVRGFSEETHIEPVGNHFTTAKPLVDAALKRISAFRGEPFFLYIHFLDAHAPYNLAGHAGTEYERYLRELALVDAQIGRLVGAIEQSAMRDRAAVFITSDHGEAFGEHGKLRHSTSVYDELLRVPLIAYGARLQARRVVDTPVSLIDLGPTILDLFGIETPGTFMGQSLVPLLRGEAPTLTRPIFADSRMRRALVEPDGAKIIVDDRAHTVELYDLQADPGELASLADDDALLRPPLSRLRRFLSAHTLRREGYTLPYRR